MFKNQTIRNIRPAIILVAFICLASDGEKSITISGFGAYEFGQIAHGYFPTTQVAIDHLWLQRAYLQAMVSAKVNDHAKVLLGLESMLSFSEPIVNNVEATLEPINTIYFHQAEGTYGWGNADTPWLEAGVGYFPFKYNPDATDLGEYLFRSGTYPPFIVTSFDFPMARLLGLHVTWSCLNDAVNVKALFTSDSWHYPAEDFSLTLLPTVTLCNRAVQIGAGVNLAHLISVNSRRTSPHDNRIMCLTNFDSTTMTGDTNYYTFKGTKLMARFSIDPKRFFMRDIPERGSLGKEDLKVYGEAAILGLDDYSRNVDRSVAYDTLTKRIPVMLGINLPTHPLLSYCILPGVLGWGLEANKSRKAMSAVSFGSAGIVAGAASWLLDRFVNTHSRLDLLSLEGEWYGWNYGDDYRNVSNFQIPLPINEPGRNYALDDTKWSLYVRKDFGAAFSVRGQLARDHMRPVCNDRKFSEKGAVLIQPEHWYWMMKIACAF